MITINSKDKRPIHTQISDGIKELIMTKMLNPGDKIPSVRELSTMLTVNPNTIQKAYKVLENEKYIYSVSGKGNFVSDEIPNDTTKLNELLEVIERVLRELKFLETDKKYITDLVDKIYEEEK